MLRIYMYPMIRGHRTRHKPTEAFSGIHRAPRSLGTALTQVSEFLTPQNPKKVKVIADSYSIMTNRPPPLPPRRHHDSKQPVRCRYHRPAVPPANIPASQTSEYICFDDCSGIVRYPMIWFRSSVAPNFLVCTTCFEQHIRSTPLAASFTGKVETLGDDGACMFGKPRIQEILWPPNRRSASLNQIHTYMIERSKYPKCRGKSGLNGREARAIGMTWYNFAQNAVPHFVACRACLEEHVMGTRFEHMFIPHATRQGDADQWACDVAIPYVQRIIKAANESGDWSGMVSGITRRLSVPACNPNSPVKANSRIWHRLTAWQHSCVCEGCYLDQVAMTAIENEFSPATVPVEARESFWTCDLAGVPAQEVVEMAITRKDTAPLHKFFHVIMTTPPCTPQGIVGGKWYTLKGGCPNFDVCATCYTGLIETHYLGAEFQMRDDVRADQGLGCDFNVGTPRGLRYLNKLGEAIVSPHFEIFNSFVRRTAHLNPCQQNARLENAAWWRLEGTQNFVACEECYEIMIRNTVCSNLFTMVGVVDGGVLCCFYSTNIRQRYQALCNANSANARADFIAYANHRQSVFAQTVPVMESILAQAQIKLMQQRMNNMNSSFYQTLDMTAGAANGIIYGPTSPYKTVYESSAPGRRYNTPWGVESEQYSAQAMGAVHEVQNDTMRVRILEATWREVE